MDIKQPVRDELEYYGDTYSVPVVAYDCDGNVLPYMVRWNFPCEGWVIAHLPDGPCPSDYESLNVSTWMDPARHF